ncbi:HAAS signaling domain-containing protein [Kitasatospora sp. NPDC003701]
MNDTLAHPLVRVYLSSVEERTAALPEARRRELLADLSEHIEVALAEAGGFDESGVRRVLDQLGTPGEIAAAALAEEPGDQPVPESGRRTAVTAVLIAAQLPAALVPAVGPLLAPVVTVVALVRLWRSRQWSRREKGEATLLMFSPLVAVPVLAVLLSVALGGLSPIGLMVAVLLALPLPTVGAVRLARSAARLRARQR